MRNVNRSRENKAAVALRAFYSIVENNAAYCNTARLHLANHHGIDVSQSTVRRWIKRMRFSRKRLSSKVLGTVDNEKVRDFLERHAQAVMPDTLVVSLDECYFSERVMPLYGYSEAGKRCALRIKSSGTWKMRSLILAIASDGTTHHQLKMGSVKREDFGEFVLNMQFPPGTVVLMDNCSTHKWLNDVFDARDYIPMFLPPYSPKLQPVELAFSKIKNSFRNKWPWPGTVENAVEESVAALSTANILGFFRHVDTEMTGIFPLVDDTCSILRER